jgi:hypothetical protein
MLHSGVHGALFIRKIANKMHWKMRRADSGGFVGSDFGASLVALNRGGPSGPCLVSVRCEWSLEIRVPSSRMRRADSRDFVGFDFGASLVALNRGGPSGPCLVTVRCESSLETHLRADLSLVQYVLCKRCKFGMNKEMEVVGTQKETSFGLEWHGALYRL